MNCFLRLRDKLIAVANETLRTSPEELEESICRLTTLRRRIENVIIGYFCFTGAMAGQWLMSFYSLIDNKRPPKYEHEPPHHLFPFLHAMPKEAEIAVYFIVF